MCFFTKSKPAANIHSLFRLRPPHRITPNLASLKNNHRMRNPSRLLTAATLLLLIGATSAAPPPPPPLTSSALEARGPEATEASEAWVTVDSSGVPATVTPVVTADGDGAATTISNAVPEELTATVFTRTEYAEVTTSTAGPAGPVPTATGEDGSGSFLACDNADGPYFPFCQPAQNSSLYPGTTYYGMYIDRRN